MSVVKSWSLVETPGGNKYIYDQKIKRFHLCHPLLHYFIKLSEDKDENEIKNWLNNRENNLDYVDIENYGRFSRSEIEYYIQKFLLLKENGYFTHIDQKKRLDKVLNADTVKRSLTDIVHVVFETTDRCNLSCYYCGYGKLYDNYDERGNKNMDVRIAKKLLDYLAELWRSSSNYSDDRGIFISFYGGEPLLNFPFITEIVQYVKQLKIRNTHFIFSMTTNGTLIQKYIDFLYENDFYLSISLDGNEQNNAYRIFKNGEPTFSTILENAKALQKKFPDYFKNRVSFNAVLHNKNSVSDIYHFFKNHFNTHPNIDPLGFIGVKEAQKKEFWNTYVNIDQSLHESEDYSVIEKDMMFKFPNIRDRIRFIHLAADFCFENYYQLIYDTDNSTRLPTGTCLPFSQKIFLTVNGKLLPCERIGQQFFMGIVTPDNVELDFEKIAERYNNYYSKIKKQCNICYNAEFCSQCIFNIRTIEEKDIICKGFMSETDYVRYHSAFLSYIEDEPGSYFKMLKGEDHE